MRFQSDKIARRALSCLCFRVNFALPLGEAGPLRFYFQTPPILQICYRCKSSPIGHAWFCTCLQVKLLKDDMKNICAQLSIAVTRLEGTSGITVRAYAKALVDFLFGRESQDRASLRHRDTPGLKSHVQATCKMVYVFLLCARTHCVHEFLALRINCACWHVSPSSGGYV